MKAPSSYLTAAKIEEIEAQLRGDGYDVTVNPGGPDAGYDLVASKNGKRLAFQVKAQSDLRASLDEIQRLRQRSHEQGYHEFRLVVVTPPRTVDVEVEGLEDHLQGYLTEHFPAKLSSLSSTTRLGSVSDIEIDAVRITRDGIRIAGTGAIKVELSWGGNGRGGLEVADTFPFCFDMRLNSSLDIREVNSLEVDTSSFEE